MPRPHVQPLFYIGIISGVPMVEVFRVVDGQAGFSADDIVLWAVKFAQGQTFGRIAVDFSTDESLIAPAIISKVLREARQEAGYGEIGFGFHVIDNLNYRTAKPFIDLAKGLVGSLQLGILSSHAHSGVRVRRVQVAALLADPDHCDKDDAELAQVMWEVYGKIVVPTQVRDDLKQLYALIEGGGCRRKLATMLYLAPFEEAFLNIVT